MFMGIVDHASGPMLPPVTKFQIRQSTPHSHTFRMKSNTRTQRILHSLDRSLGCLVLIPTAICTAIPTKQDNTTDLNLGGRWNTPPGVADIARWTNAVTAAKTTASLSADLSWRGIKIVGPGGAVTINSGNTLTLGTSGIDLSTVKHDLNRNCGLTLQGDKQSWKAAAGNPTP